MTLSTLSELLEASQSDYRVYDLGRRLQQLQNDDFQRVSQQQAPYPTPIQGAAMFAIEFWPQPPRQVESPYLWFLKLPIDERGLLDFNAQQEFVLQVTALLGHQLTGSLSEEQQQQLQHSAYLFTPSEQRLAALHAQLALRWQQPPSNYFAAAQQALKGATENWQQLGLQGLHDVAARLAEDDSVRQVIGKQFDQYPAPLQQALAETLEHHPLPLPLLTDLVTQLQQQEQPSALRQCLLRAIAAEAATDTVHQALTYLLQGPVSDDELLIIAARLWTALAWDQTMTNNTLLESFLVKLASTDSESLFGAIISDLLRIPQLRPHLLIKLSQPDLNPSVASAWYRFTHSIHQSQGSHHAH